MDLVIKQRSKAGVLDRVLLVDVVFFSLNHPLVLFVEMNVLSKTKERRRMPLRATKLLS